MSLGFIYCFGEKKKMGQFVSVLTTEKLMVSQQKMLTHFKGLLIPWTPWQGLNGFQR